MLGRWLEHVTTLWAAHLPPWLPCRARPAPVSSRRGFLRSNSARPTRRAACGLTKVRMNYTVAVDLMVLWRHNHTLGRAAR